MSEYSVMSGKVFTRREILGMLTCAGGLLGWQGEASAADALDALEDNVPGAFFVDSQCIDCDLCRETAPNNFKRSESGGFSYVFKQPANARELAACREARDGCPVEAIGDDRRPAAEVPERKMNERNGPGDDPPPPNARLQKEFHRFPLLKPKNDVDGNAVSTELSLNREPLIIGGERYDGFRFEVGAEERNSFVWSFRTQSKLKSWCILPEVGEMKGLDGYWTLPDGSVIQNLHASSLKPGKQYLICLSFGDDLPAVARVVFKFAPLKRDCPLGDAVKALGL